MYKTFSENKKSTGPFLRVTRSFEKWEAYEPVSKSNQIFWKVRYIIKTTGFLITVKKQTKS